MKICWRLENSLSSIMEFSRLEIRILGPLNDWRGHSSQQGEQGQLSHFDVC